MGGSSIQGDQYGGTGGIFLKNTFSPRMKIGQPPISSSSNAGGAANSNLPNHNNLSNSYQGGSLSGPVKAAHHSRPGMGGQTRTSGGMGTGGGLDESRSPQSNGHSFNA